MLGPLSEPLQQPLTLMPKSLEQAYQQMGAAQLFHPSQCIRFECCRSAGSTI